MAHNDSRPNIVVFFTDQQRWDTCGCYGQPLDTTPELDRLAAEGVRFEYAFTPQPLCGPVRAVLQGGRYATELGCWKNNCPLPHDCQPIARRLRASGYETAYVGKWHLASGAEYAYRDAPVPPQARGGYDDFWLAADALEHTSHGYDGHMYTSDGERRDFPEGSYRVDVQTDWAIEYLQARSWQDRPLFLMVSYLEPHHQNDHDRYEGPHGSKERFADFPVPGDLEGTQGDWRENYPDYLGCVNSLDANLGRLRRTLEELGQWDNTLLIFTSDHGTHFRTRNREYKRSCHESSIRVPMVLHGGAFQGGRNVEQLVSLIDIPATILAAAGLDVPEQWRGRPLQQLTQGPVEDWPDDVFVQISESHTGRAVRTRHWKYAVAAPDSGPGGRRHNQPFSDVYEEACLHDLQDDPHERDNRVSDPSLADVRARLRQRLAAHMEAIGEPAATIHPAPAAAP